ncbi:MAG: prepilin-type N-terminal cleavage/methylation domain-containing protein [Candidatus Falkowbacteria bacterium]
MNIKNNNLGYTLVEMVIAVGLFSIMMLAVTQIFQMVVEGQRSAIASQNIQESMRYAIEMTGKEMRMAQLEVGGSGQCPNVGNNRVYDITSSSQVLNFKNRDGDCMVYSLDSGRLKREIRGVEDFYITPDDIVISNLEFVVDDSPATTNDQQIVTVKMEIEAIGKEMHKQPIIMQTTISSRSYE